MQLNPSSATAHEAYRLSLLDIYQSGQRVHVRGYDTLELMDYVTVIREPWHHCHFVPGRRWNPWLALSEALWILAGRNDLAPLLPYNKRAAEFSDDGNTLWGAYGLRIRDQIEPLIRRLKEDPNDRRAILQIWRVHDLNAKTKDPPCNDMAMFKIRNGKLHMTVINRSNDLHWGLYGVNLPTFGLLQEYLAACLQVEMGDQTHLSNSLHIYTGGPGMKENWRITERMLAAANKPLPVMPWHDRAFTEPIPPDTLRAGCNAVLNNGMVDIGRITDVIPFLEFADDFLRAYRLERVDTIWDDCRHADYFADWLFAAQTWIEETEYERRRFK